jgi:hypothetical protein
MTAQFIRFPIPRLILGLFVLLGMVFVRQAAFAATFPPPKLTEDGIDFERLGQATFRWMRVVNVYDAALHIGAGHDRSKPLAGVPLRLEIHYRRAFTAAEIVKGGDALLERNVPAELLESLRPRLDLLNRAYRDVKSNDSYVLSYLPGKGTVLRLNGTELVTIEGEDFANAYFRIWLGDEPISTSLRDQLLGR